MLSISVQLIQVHAASMGEREGPTHALHGVGGRVELITICHSLWWLSELCRLKSL